MSPPRIVVVGNGMVGQRFLEELAASREGSRERGAGASLTGAWSVSVFAEECRPAYDRVQLSSFFSGKTIEDLSLAPPDFFAKHGISLHLNERVTGIDRDSRIVRTARGRELIYDVLVLATGSHPFVPLVPGRDRPSCFVYRTVEDLEAIREAAQSARTGAVVGGGLLGLEAAKALRDLRLETHVVSISASSSVTGGCAGHCSTAMHATASGTSSSWRRART
ncbi:MAG TPA: FAD-dependent oxidoreductase [Steroidobacteraceae bacterium]